MSGTIEQQVHKLTRRVNRLDSAREHDRFKVPFKKLDVPYYKVTYEDGEYKSANNIWWAVTADDTKEPLYINGIPAYYESLTQPEDETSSADSPRAYKRVDDTDYEGTVTFIRNSDIKQTITNADVVEFISSNDFSAEFSQPTYGWRCKHDEHIGSNLYVRFAEKEGLTRLVTAIGNENVINTAIENGHIKCFYAEQLSTIDGTDDPNAWNGTLQDNTVITFTKQETQKMIPLIAEFNLIGKLDMQLIFDTYANDDTTLYYKPVDINKAYADIIKAIIGDETDGHFTYTDDGLFTDLFLVDVKVNTKTGYLSIFRGEGFTMTYSYTNALNRITTGITAAAGPLPQERGVVKFLCNEFFRYDPLHYCKCDDNVTTNEDKENKKFVSTVIVTCDEISDENKISAEKYNYAVMRIQAVPAETTIENLTAYPYGVTVKIAKVIDYSQPEHNGSIFATEKLEDDFARIVDATVDNSFYTSIPASPNTNLTTTTATPMTMAITTGPSLVKINGNKEPVKMKHEQGLCFGVNMPIGNQPWINYGGSLFNINSIMKTNVNPPCQYVIKEDGEFVIDDPAKGKRDSRLFYIIDKDYMAQAMGEEAARSREPFLLFTPLHQDCPNCKTIQ